LEELKYFESCIGLDLSLEMALSKGISKELLVQGNCYHTPFADDEFHLVSAFALLHHLVNIDDFFKEAFRILKPGGYLYTEGDKNLYCVKTERRLRMFQYTLQGERNTIKFKYYRDRLKQRDRFEYHQMGLDFRKLRKLLEKVGFQEIKIIPMFSYNPKHTKKLSFRIMRALYRLLKCKSCFTHISIIAKK
jgi:ubiquinone/menaquinone biosynthesis C-methylase UbiE